MTCMGDRMGRHSEVEPEAGRWPRRSHWSMGADRGVQKLGRHAATW